MLSLYLVYIQIWLIALILTHYFTSSRKQNLKSSLFILLIATVITPLFIFFGLDVKIVIIFIAVLNIAYIIMKRSSRLSQHYDNFRKERLSALKNTNSNLKKQDEKETFLNKQLDKRILEIANLYEITREMSIAMQFLDIFEILGKFLTRELSFKRCQLIIIDQKTHRKINKIYEICGIPNAKARKTYISKANAALVQADEIRQNLVRQMNETKEIVRLDSFSKVLDMGKDYLPKDCESFLATPLVVEDELIGILSIENLSPEDFDNFLILNRQFILEMRKVHLYGKVQELAITDGLTGAYVRRHFLERLDEELKRSQRHKFKFSFLMLDIDYFKKTNDTYGHLVGDAVLARIVNILDANVRQIDLVARYGGEEFSVILPETGKDEAFIVADRIRKAVAGDRFRVYDEFTNISVSIGISTFPEDAQGPDDLIDVADKALYKAKHEGRNRVCFFSRDNK